MIRFRHHGFTRPEVLVMLTAGATLVVVASLVTPRLLVAFERERATPIVAASVPDDAARITLETFDLLFATARAILWLDTDNDGRMLTLALWTDTTDHPGRVNPQEVTVVRYSPLLRSMRGYTITEDAAGELRGAGLEPESAAGEAWISQFLNREDLEERIIAIEVSDVRFTTIAPDAPPSEALQVGSPGWLELSWSRDSVDSAVNRARTTAAAPPRVRPN